MPQEDPRTTPYVGPDLATTASGIPDVEKNHVTKNTQSIEERPFPSGVYDERSYHPEKHRSEL